MSTIRFNDGMSFDTSGPLRITRRRDGLYVIGGGMLIPISDAEEGKQIIQQEAARHEARRAMDQMTEASRYAMPSSSKEQGQ